MTEAPAGGGDVAAAVRRRPLGMRIAYSVSTAGFGAFEGATRYFLLIYYSQVAGLDSALAGLAIGISLMFDAVFDPTIGAISDRTRTRLGRRHPYMFAAIVPAAIFFYALWSPPAGLSQTALFAYLLVVSAATRMSMSLFEIPSASLLPEFTPSYEERTQLVSWRYAAQFIGGMTASVAGYAIFFRATPDYPNGVLNPAGWVGFGVFGAAIVTVTFATGALGTRALIPELRARLAATVADASSLRRIFQSFRNRSFRVVILFSVMTSMAFAMSGALQIYINTYYWGFTSEQLGIVPLFNLVSIAIALALTPWLGKRMDKHRAGMWAAFAVIALIPLPFLLKAGGLLPPTGSAPLLWVTIVFNVIDLALIITATVLTSSMVADIVEDQEVTTGRRDEGVFFSVRNFAKNAVAGVGVVLAGLVLRLVDFPTKAKVGPEATDAAERLILAFVPLFILLLFVGVAALRFYSVTRLRHAENLDLLARRSTGGETPA